MNAGGTPPGQRVLGAHQPNFLPWLPYFAKIATCDVFVILDDAQYPQGSWVNRVRLDLPGGMQWLSVPVHAHLSSLIHQVSIDYSRDWVKKALASLRQAYSRHAHFQTLFPGLEEIFLRRPGRLLELNLSLLDWALNWLGLTPQLVFSSRLQTSGRGSRRLVELCQQLQASHYLAGEGARNYEDVQLYQDAGVAYRMQSFAPPQYCDRRGRPRTPGLSVLDALMELGPQGVRQLLPGGQP